jgi:hypothetical protein
VRGAQAEPSKLNQRLQLQSALPVSAPRARTNARTHAAAGRATNTLRGCLGQKCHTLPPATRRTLPHLLGKTVEAKSYATCSAAAACASSCSSCAGGKQPPMHFGLHRRRVGLRRHLQPVVPRALWCSHAPRTRGAFPSSAWWTVRSGAGGRVSMRLPARARDLLHVLCLGGRPRTRVLRCVQGTASVVTCAFSHPLLPAPDGHSDRELGSEAPCPSSAATPRAARR